MADAHKFSSTQVDLPDEIAKLLIAKGKSIPDEDIDQEDGRESESHVTVKYGLHGSDSMPVKKALAGESPVRLKLGKTALFKNPDQHVLIIEIESPDLHRLNCKVADSGPVTDTHPDYKPHATIAYLKPGKGAKYEGSNEFAGLEAEIPSVTFSSKDGSKSEIQLTGKPTGAPMAKKMAYERRMARDARKMPPPDAAGPGEFGALPPAEIPHEQVTDAPQFTKMPPALPEEDPAQPAPLAAAPPVDVRASIADQVRKSPGMKIAGQAPGESFNEFRVRALSAVRGAMQKLAGSPSQSIVIPKHSQVSRLVQGWVAAGMPDDLSVDPKAITVAISAKPGEVEQFAPDEAGAWELSKFDPKQQQELPQGAIYFVEHGETPATAASSAKISAGQKARAEIISAVRSGDWKGAQKAAQRSAGLLSDDEISEAIDEAIPGPDDVENHEPHELLAMASAAGPQKRAELMPILQARFGEMHGVSPDGAHALRSHLGRLG